MFVDGTYYSSEQEFVTETEHSAKEVLAYSVDAVEEALEFLRKAYRAGSRTEAQSAIVEASAFLTALKRDAEPLL